MLFVMGILNPFKNCQVPYTVTIGENNRTYSARWDVDTFEGFKFFCKKK
ncbi:MAG: hypothetical protein CM15mP122_5280 [Bacteroidota bacterium]|nr:MAG: hypothetical protein CM15mP122_5280 [Bacteroidota bacterium]